MNNDIFKYSIAVIVLILLELLFASEKNKPFFRKYFFHDICYTIINKGFAFGLGGFFIFYLMDGRPFIWRGFGPLRYLPLWGQIAIVILMRDLLAYWIHRIFHSKVLWPFHQIHHQAAPVDWLSSYRFHPFNFMFYILRVPTLYYLGFSGKAIVLLSFITEFHSFFTHANLSWNFGIFKKILVSPRFHRFHHEKRGIAGHSNYSTIFSFWDILFCTYYYKDELPAEAGLDYDYHQGLWGQFFSPFKESYLLIKTYFSKRKE